MNGNKDQIFISYAREDSNDARRLYRELCDRNYSVWFDEEDLLPGSEWEPSIRKAINESRWFLALLSPASIDKRGFVQKEIREALEIAKEFPEGNIFFIPVRIKKCEPSYHKIYAYNWVDMFPHWNSGLEKLLKVFSLSNSSEGSNNTSNSRTNEYLKKALSLITSWLPIRKVMDTKIQFAVSGDHVEISHANRMLNSFSNYVKNNSFDYVVGINRGGILLASYLGQQLEFPDNKIIRASVNLEGVVVDKAKDLKGRILIVDDVCRSGTTIKVAADIISRNSEVKLIDTAALIDVCNKNKYK